MSDDQSWADVGYYPYNNILTPTLDDMAAKGVRFDRFYAAHPKCAPNRAAVLTGRASQRCGVKVSPPINPYETTIADALSKYG